MFVVVVVLLTQGWPTLEGRRELTAEEMRDVRRRMGEWTARVPAFAGLAGLPDVEILRAARTPHLQVEWVRVMEERRVEEVLRPYREGKLLHRRESEVDPWSVSAPPPPLGKRFDSYEHRVRVDGSGEVRSCGACAAVGVARCPECSAEKLTCLACSGRGKTWCALCARMAERGGRCAGCGGTRQAVCASCAGLGRRICKKCLGHGLATCVVCDGSRRVLASLEVVIAVTAHREERLLSDAQAWWPRLVPFGSAWTAEAEGDDVASAVMAVRDTWVQSALHSMVGAARTQGGREIGRRLRAKSVPVTWVGYRWRGRAYELVITDRGIVATDTPMRHWAQVRAGEGDGLAQRQSWSEAERAYREALMVDPGCGAARAGLRNVARATAATWQSTALWVLVPVAVAIALTMAGLKLYLRRRALRGS